MLIRCETKSNRVKGLSFHPKLNWILASLHNGVIQMWDFRIGALIHRYEEHEGPVRGVCFHVSQPMFVSGGDDYKIKVWNYVQHRCLFTLLGHLDYIRTVQFHPDYPWILSASDDQTLRIWNWQNRSCIAVLAGHNHYVMSAQFHPKQELLISASLDQTLRVWDISGLREKNYSILMENGKTSSITGASPRGPSLLVMSAQQTDMFGTADTVCKFILDGHDRGVNWATFHPTVSLIASGGDDRTVKLWRYNDSKWWEVDTFRGHLNNVSCVIFHPTKEILLSNSEDRSIRVWDITKRVLLHTYRRENDRFWVLASMPESNTLGVGHDSGVVVFKLARERIPAQVVDKNIFFINDGWLSLYNCTTNTTTTLVGCRSQVKDVFSSCRQLSVNLLNPSFIDILVLHHDSDSTEYDLIRFPSIESVIASAGNATIQQGIAKSVAFVSRNRFAALDSSGAISMFSLNLEFNKRIEPPVPITEIFFAGHGHLLLKTEETVLLYDVHGKKTISELNCPGGLRYVHWSPTFSHVALLCKHYVTLATAKLQYLCSVYENIRVKSGAWDSAGKRRVQASRCMVADHACWLRDPSIVKALSGIMVTGAFVYSTLSHIKYCLPNGDHGLLQCLTHPFYITRIEAQKMWGFDRRNSHVVTRNVNCTEYLFKTALVQKNTNQVVSLIRHGKLCGNAIVNYLKTRNFSNVALQFVSDRETRFTLASESCNLDVACAEAMELQNNSLWESLGVQATRQGNFDITERAYQNTKSFHKLTFLYFLLGDTVKLRKMLKIANVREDNEESFFTSLLLGDVEERIRVLTSMGQIPLAILTSRLYGLQDMSTALEEALDHVELHINAPLDPVPFTVPPPLIAFTNSEPDSGVFNWPTVPLTDLPSADVPLFSRDEPLQFTESSQLLDHDYTQREPKEYSELDVTVGLEDGNEMQDAEAWKEMDDIDDTELFEHDATREEQQSFPPTDFPQTDCDDIAHLGKNAADCWCTTDKRVYPYVAAGRFKEALHILSKRIALINPEPLKPVFRTVLLSTRVALPLLPLFPSKQLPLLERGCLLDHNHQPMNCVTIELVETMVKEGGRLVVAGKLDLALETYRQVLHHLTLAEASTKDEDAQLSTLLATARCYALAMSIECHRQTLPETEIARIVELAAYLGSCRLSLAHQFLTWRRALTVAWKAKNYVTAALFARKLIQTDFGKNIKGVSEAVAQAKKALAISETRGTDAHHVDFDPSDLDSLVLCSSSLTRIHPFHQTIQCQFCGSVAKSDYADTLCHICNLSKLGARVLGLRFLYEDI